MKKILLMMGVTGLMAGVLITGGCGGGGGGDDAPVTPVVTTDGPVVVTGSGSSNASAANVTYQLPAPAAVTSTTVPAGTPVGSYTLTVIGAGANDKFEFPSGPGVSVDNVSFTDGVVDLVTQTANGEVRVKMTVTAAQDAQILTLADINTLFGAGTVTQK